MNRTCNRIDALRRRILLLGAVAALAVAGIRPGYAIQLLDENGQSGSAFSTDGAPKSWLTAAVNNWMGGLPVATALSAMSIPGTHDSGAMHGGLAVQTQSLTIAEQLQAGLRYFDIRLRRTKTAFAVHHGSFYQHQMFGDVMNAVTAFLRAHPTEAVLMRVKDEYTAEAGSASFADIWAGYMKRYGNYVYKGNGTFPTLGQIRGKVLVLRNADFSGYGVTYSENTIQDHYKVYFLAHKMVNGDSVSLPSKKDEVAKYLDLAATSRTGKLVLNHLSGAEGMAPKDVARATDGAAYDHIGPYSGRKTLGVVIMDFPGDRMIYRVIKTNFSFSGSCPARTFRSVSAHSWVEFRLPAATRGRVIEIPGGAYNKYVFPKCNRVHWSDLSFFCGSNGQWTRTKGSWDSDALCHGSKGSSPYVAVGNK